MKRAQLSDQRSVGTPTYLNPIPAKRELDMGWNNPSEEDSPDNIRQLLQGFDNFAHDDTVAEVLADAEAEPQSATASQLLKSMAAAKQSPLESPSYLSPVESVQKQLPPPVQHQQFLEWAGT